MRKIMGMAGMVAAAAMMVAPASTIQIVARDEDEARAEKKRERAPAPQRISLNRGSSPLNRSRRWPYAATYKEARTISPFPLNPIR